MRNTAALLDFPHNRKNHEDVVEGGCSKKGRRDLVGWSLRRVSGSIVGELGGEGSKWMSRENTVRDQEDRLAGRLSAHRSCLFVPRWPPHALQLAPPLDRFMEA